MKVYIWPMPSEAPKGTGIGRVVHAQYDLLPRHGITLVARPEQADVVACHTQQGRAPRVDVLHCHGLYWNDIPHAPFASWHEQANQQIISAARQALAITVPSDWVAMPFRRDMRIDPVVIGHGVEPEAWDPLDNGGFVLWNKNRPADVCDPTPAWELASRGVQVVSTFGLDGQKPPAQLRVVGSQPWEAMRNLVRQADVYLATTRETFGIGTLEALAAGVPVLGYRWGGTADIVRHEVEGWLVDPGDLDGLAEGLQWIRKRRSDLSVNARARAREFTWDQVMAQYAELFMRVGLGLTETAGETGVAVVIPAYNYARYLAQAVNSVLEQSFPAQEIIVVDDGSTDETPGVMQRYDRYPQVRYIRQANSGVAAARNRGVAETSQAFIVCLDADDHLDRFYIETCRAAFLKDRQLGIAYTGLAVEGEDGLVHHYNWPPEFSWDIQGRAKVPPANCVPSAAMFRRAMWERAGGYRQEFAPGEDAEFWTRGLSVGFTARRVTEHRLFRYRAHKQSASRRLKYVPIDARLPWLRDGRYPMAVPSKVMPEVRSYAEPIMSVLIRVGPGQEAKVGELLEDLTGQTVRAWEAAVSAATSEALDAALRRYPFALRLPVLRGKPLLAQARAPLALILDGEARLLPATALEDMLDKYVISGGKRPAPLVEVIMGKCCGGQAKALLDAKRVVSGARTLSPQAATSAAVPRGGDNMIRMQFTGTRAGAVTYHGHNGRMYKGGNTPLHRFANVHPDDVERLLSTGVWELVAAPQPVAPAPAIPVQIPAPAEEAAVEAGVSTETPLAGEAAPPKPPARRRTPRASAR